MDETASKPDARPLYAQVRDIFLERIHSGTWGPGQRLPSETQLAAELDVSQGTVRKALDTLAEASLVRRKQGRGTFVIEHTSSDILFKFFQIYDADGNRVLPDVGKTRFGVRKATGDIARSLSIEKGDDVLEISRVRTHKSQTFMAETVVLPLALFPGLMQRETFPNTLYDMFQKEYGVTISHVDEDLTAITANKRLAAELNVDVGAPILKIDRIAYDIEQIPIERRISYCTSEELHYRAKLR